MFAGAATGRVHLIVQTTQGEVGFFVDDDAAWIDAIGRATSGFEPRDVLN